MSTLIIKAKSEEEHKFLKMLLEKMHVEVKEVDESSPNYTTIEAIEDARQKKGTRVNDSSELFNNLGI
jgi:antitoxin component of RelBE/YafQ-DinJ toxin-antitoxin module